MNGWKGAKAGFGHCKSFNSLFNSVQSNIWANYYSGLVDKIICIGIVLGFTHRTFDLVAHQTGQSPSAESRANKFGATNLKYYEIAHKMLCLSYLT